MKTLLLLISAGKFGKLMLSAGSMILSVFTYSLIYGWIYACGFVALLLTHELGHYMAARQRNLDVGLPTFIPFVGAWIELKEQPMDAETEAFVGLAGPMLGSFAAYVLYLVSLTQEPGIWTALAYAGFMLNLFNLIPLSPLDGGRIVSVISPKLWFLGVPVLIAAFVWHPSPMLLIVALLSAPHLWTAFKERNQPASNYHQADKLIKVQYGLQYICLVIFLAVLSYNAHENLSHVRMSQGT